jgi:subtilisin family serine protease
LAPRILIVLAAFLASPSPASADLVQLDPSHAREGGRLARSAGGTELASELRIWRVPTYAVADLRRAGVVQLSRPDRMLTAAGQLQAPTDPLVPQQWWRGAVGVDQVEAPGPGKPVTVVDSGLDMSHPEFASRANTTVLNTQTISEPDEDHGTEVSSVLAAPLNGVGVVGVYPEAVLRFWDASPFGILSESSAIQGIVEAARRGPGVINLSFGGEDDDPMLEDAILFAFRSGSIVVAAAGNDGLEGSPKNFPAAYAHVLTVGATNESGRVAGFSTLSPTIDLSAPGVRIPVAEPISYDAAGYAVANGTSFASPLVAGAAAWVWTVRPDLDNSQLFEIMRRSSTDIAEPGFDHASGYGLLNIPNALSFKTPARDLQEPNEDPAAIEPHRLFASGTPPLTHSGNTSASITAHLDRSEDPVDLYRAWAPPKQTLRARVTGHVTVRLLPRAVITSKTQPLGVGKHGLAVYRNGGARGLYVYVELRPALRFAEYTLRLTVARR